MVAWTGLPTNIISCDVLGMGHGLNTMHRLLLRQETKRAVLGCGGVEDIRITKATLCDEVNCDHKKSTIGMQAFQNMPTTYGCSRIPLTGKMAVHLRSRVRFGRLERMIRGT